MFRSRSLLSIPMMRRAATVAAPGSAGVSTCMRSNATSASTTTSHSDESSSSSSSWGSSRIGGTLAGLLVFPSVCYFTMKSTGMLDIPPPSHHTTEDEAEADDDADILMSDVSLVNKVSLGGPFEMRDCNTNTRITDNDVFPGKWTMLYFGFTRCAEICPNTMKFMQTMYETAKEKYKGQYDKDVDNMQVLFVSVDHIRDKPQDLAKFLANYKLPCRGVVPDSREDVDNVTKAWRVYVSSVDETDEEREAREAKGVDAPDPTAEHYQLDHSAAIYFVGPDGKLKDYFFKEIPVDQAVDRLSLHFENVYGLGK